TIFISTIPSIVFVTIFLIDIWCYKKNLAQLKITVEKYNDTSLSAIGELLSLYSKCKKSIVWSIADVFARNHVS
ncbi:MAG: hypothetical protein LBV22_02850, partial [Mycoplasmataceae bacterium]|nr:hypothetical protein [Mycoplasmataceae bacterium]